MKFCKIIEDKWPEKYHLLKSYEMLYNCLMVREKLEEYIMLQGFLPLNSNIKEISALVKIENNLLNIIQIFDYTKEMYLDVDQYNEIKKSITKTFQNQGISSVHILSLFLTEDRKKGQNVIQSDPFCWEMDAETQELIIGEDKQPDFYGMRKTLEKFREYYLTEKDRETDEVKTEGKAESFLSRTVNFLKGEPHITLALMIVNSLIFILSLKWPDALYVKGWLDVRDIVNGEWYRLITAMFLHQNFEHLVNNMICLYVLGRVLEKKMGPALYLLMYFLTGVTGNVVSCLYELFFYQNRVSYGASGAVFGLIGVMLGLVLLKDKDLNIRPVEMLVLVGLNVYSTFASENINISAHLGGLVSGLIYISVYHFFTGKRTTEKRI